MLIDRDAAGYGWFVDPTPDDGAEFSPLRQQLVARSGTAADLRVDLLTTVMHEMGHALGYDDITIADDLMSVMLPLGVRRTAFLSAPAG